MQSVSCASSASVTRKSLQPSPVPAWSQPLGMGDAGQTRGRSLWGDRKRRLEADGRTLSVSCPYPLWTAALRPGVCSASGATETAETHPFSRIFLPLLDDLFASLPRISSPAIYGDFIAAQTEAASCSHAQGSSPYDSILVFTLVCAKTPFILSPSRAWLVPGTKQLHLMGTPREAKFLCPQVQEQLLHPGRKRELWPGTGKAPPKALLLPVSLLLLSPSWNKCQGPYVSPSGHCVGYFSYRDKALTKTT